MFAGGILFEYVTSFVRAKKGNSAVTELEKKTGPLIFDTRRMYDAAAFFKLMDDAVTLTHGSEDKDTGYYELGQFVMHRFLDTIVGASLFPVGSSAKELLGKKFQELGDTMVNFGKRKLLEIDEKKGEAIVEISEDPRPIAYFRGVIEGKLEDLGFANTKTDIVERAPNYKIHVTWTPPKKDGNHRVLPRR